MPTVSRTFVVHGLPLLLPGLSAPPPSTSFKIIPCMSREANKRAQCQLPSFTWGFGLPPSGSIDRGRMPLWSTLVVNRRLRPVLPLLRSGCRGRTRRRPRCCAEHRGVSTTRATTPEPPSAPASRPGRTRRARGQGPCVQPPCRLCAVDQVDAFACRLSPGAGLRCGPVARCEWVAISSAACRASTSQGACPPGTS